MKPVFFCVFLLMLTSCSSGKKEKEIAFDDLAPKSEHYKNGAGETVNQPVIVVPQRPEKSSFLAIADTLMPESNWMKWDTLLFPDRFGAKTTEKWIVTGKQDSLVFLRYEFKDSLRTKNAFFNWIDCFGPKCKSYEVGDNIRIPKRNGLMLISEKQLIFVESNRPVKEAEIRGALEKDPEKENWIYLVLIPKKGKTTWKRITKGIEQPIIKTNENS